MVSIHNSFCMPVQQTKIKTLQKDLESLSLLEIACQKHNNLATLKNHLQEGLFNAQAKE